MMAEHKFKVGDRVRLTEDNHGFGNKGDTGTLIREPDYVRFDREVNGGTDWFVAPHHLEPVLTIRAGKYYRTRDGRKVGPMESDAPGYLSALVDGEWKSFEIEGGKNVIDNDFDLIAEWVDEPVKGGPVTVGKQKFKVGDKIRRTDVGWRKEGFEIKKIEDGKAYLDDTYGGSCPYEIDHNFALAEPAVSSSSPAIVCRIDNGQPMPAMRPHVHASVADASTEATRLAKANPGREFAVYEMVHSVTEDLTYDHQWQREAVAGRKIYAIKELRGLTGMTLKGAKDAVEHWLEVNAA